MNILPIDTSKMQMSEEEYDYVSQLQLEKAMADPQFIVNTQIPLRIRCTKCKVLYPNAKRRDIEEALTFECWGCNHPDFDSRLLPERNYFEKIKH
jgi:hypothetical protein